MITTDLQNLDKSVKIEAEKNEECSLLLSRF